MIPRSTSLSPLSLPFNELNPSPRKCFTLDCKQLNFDSNERKTEGKREKEKFRKFKKFEARENCQKYIRERTSRSSIVEINVESQTIGAKHIRNLSNVYS